MSIHLNESSHPLDISCQDPTREESIDDFMDELIRKRRRTVERIEAIISPQVTKMNFSSSRCPVRIAREIDVCNELQNGVTKENTLGLAPLHIAVFYGRLGIVRRLVEKSGDNINALDKDGWTPFLIACLYSAKTESKNNRWKQIARYLFPLVDKQIKVKIGQQSLDFTQIIILGKTLGIFERGQEQEKKRAYERLRSCVVTKASFSSKMR